MYEAGESLKKISNITPKIHDLRDTLMDYTKRYGAGSAIAALQIGVVDMFQNSDVKLQ